MISRVAMFSVCVCGVCASVRESACVYISLISRIAMFCVCICVCAC